MSYWEKSYNEASGFRRWRRQLSDGVVIIVQETYKRSSKQFWAYVNIRGILGNFRGLKLTPWTGSWNEACRDAFNRVQKLRAKAVAQHTKRAHAKGNSRKL